MRRSLLIAICLSALLMPWSEAPRAREKAFGAVYLRPLKDGDAVLLAGLMKRGPLVLNFWASYCKPCKREMPELEKLMKGHGHARLVFINIDPRKRVELVRRLVKAWGVRGVVLLDQYQIAARKYSPGLKVPATILIDGRGRIAYRSLGYTRRTIPDLDKQLRKLREAK